MLPSSELESSSQSLTERLKISDADINRVLEGRVSETFEANDPRWRDIRAEAIGNRGISWRRLLGRRLRAGGRNGRDQAEVRQTYDHHYGNTSHGLDWLEKLDERSHAAEWRDKGMLLTPQALRAAHLLYIYRAIEVFKPRRVLEVGCGNGTVLFCLSVSFPDVQFAGVELTKAGVELAHKTQQVEELPPNFEKACVGPMLDPKAHRRVSVQQGNALSLPFPDRSFDLVYTRLALEQMEQIRPQAMSEIARVAGKAVALVEPWRDFNRVDPGRSYIRRMGYFNAEANDLKRLHFTPVLIDDDIPHKVQFKSGAVIAVRR